MGKEGTKPFCMGKGGTKRVLESNALVLGPSFALGTRRYPFVWRKGVLNGYSRTRVSLKDSLMFGRLTMGFANVRAGTRVIMLVLVQATPPAPQYKRVLEYLSRYGIRVCSGGYSSTHPAAGLPPTHRYCIIYSVSLLNVFEDWIAARPAHDLPPPS